MSMSKKVVLHFFLLCSGFSFMHASAQKGWFLGLEPNLMLANRSMKKINPEDNIQGRNAPGIGINVGYRSQIDRHFYVTGTAYFYLLRHTTILDFEKSNQQPQPDDHQFRQTVGLDMAKAIGLEASAGYVVLQGKKSSLSVAAGAHLNLALMGMVYKSVYSMQQDGVPTSYKYEIDYQGDKGNNPVVFGLDGHLNYNQVLGRRNYIIGLHYSYNPWTRLTGNFAIYKNQNLLNAGTQDMATNYLGLMIGMHLSKIKSK